METTKQLSQYESKVGIVILNYITFQLTLDCIESIKKLEYPNYFIVVVDNHSPNESMKILNERFSQDDFFEKEILLFDSEKNGGYSYGVNFGINKAEELGAEYCLILNNDIKIVESSFLDKIIDNAKQNENVALIGPAIVENDRVCPPFLINRPNLYYRVFQLILPKFSKHFEKYFYKKSFSNHYENIEHPLQVYSVHGSCMFFNLKYLKDIGYFDTNIFLFCEEKIIGEKLYLKNYKVYYLLEVKVLHNQSSTTKKSYSILKKYQTIFRNEIYYYKKYRKDVPFYLLCAFVFWGYLRYYIYLPLFARIKILMKIDKVIE